MYRGKPLTIVAKLSIGFAGDRADVKKKCLPVAYLSILNADLP